MLCVQVVSCVSVLCTVVVLVAKCGKPWWSVAKWGKLFWSGKPWWAAIVLVAKWGKLFWETATAGS